MDRNASTPTLVRGVGEECPSQVGDYEGLGGKDRVTGGRMGQLPYGPLSQAGQGWGSIFVFLGLVAVGVLGIWVGIEAVCRNLAC